MDMHRRYYRIGGITLQVESDLPFTSGTFIKAMDSFQVDGPSADTVTINHHFQLPDLQAAELGKEIYRKAPWAIYRSENEWVYLGILSQNDNADLFCIARFNPDHTRADIYHKNDLAWLRGNLQSLSLVTTDQIMIARLLADRNGCYLHSSGAILEGSGFLFVGHSEAGKSTIARLLMDAGIPATGRPSPQVEILSDDRNIVRRWETQDWEGWRVHGTWNHSAFPTTSPSSAPLRAVCFLEQSSENTLTLLTDRSEIIRRLLGCIIKPFVTADWWDKTLDLVARMARELPCYVLRFDRSGAIVPELVALIKMQ
jgi:hypothetical protein